MSIDMVRDDTLKLGSKYDTGDTTVINDGIGLVSTKTGFEEPQSRDEAILQNILGADNELQPPESRIEKILQAILYNTPYTKKPESRIEKILLAIKNNGTYTKEQESRAEAILIAKLKGLEYTEESESRIEELLIEWLDQSTYKTLEGVPPLTFKANGTPLLEWTISGNMQQTGTPTPENPIQPQECGERTGNLFDISTVEKGRIDDGEVGYVSQTSSLTIEGGTVSFTTTATYRGVCSGFFEIPEGTETITFDFIRNEALGVKFVFYDSTKTWLNQDYIPTLSNIPPATANVPSGAKYVRITFTGQISGGYSYTMSNIMLNTGSTALPYEPYGYKIPISSANTTTPVYLGEVETTRKIKKLVLTGEENWRSTSGRLYLDAIVNDYMRANGIATYLCSHYAKQGQVDSASKIDVGCIAFGSNTANQRLYIYDADISTAVDFKAYLAQQYANGTPVTVWYVLAEPTTGIVNEPLRKIGDYADTISNVAEIPTVKGSNTLSVDTTLQPSNVYIKYV